MPSFMKMPVKTLNLMPGRAIVTKADKSYSAFPEKLFQSLPSIEQEGLRARANWKGGPVFSHLPVERWKETAEAQTLRGIAAQRERMKQEWVKKNPGASEAKRANAFKKISGVQALDEKSSRDTLASSWGGRWVNGELIRG